MSTEDEDGDGFDGVANECDIALRRLVFTAAGKVNSDMWPLLIIYLKDALSDVSEILDDRRERGVPAPKA